MSTVNNNQYLSVMDISNIENLDDQDAQALAGVGVINQEDNRSATMVVRDHDMVCRQSTDDGLEMISIADALKRYDWLKEKYYFKAVSADLDEVTQKCAAQEQQLGYFIHVKKGASVSLPCQAAMYMTTNDITQVIHNIVVLEEDSKLELITGCCSGHNVLEGNHLAVEELYVGKNARLKSTMVHSWEGNITVFPRSGTIVEENGRFESNYISLQPAKTIISNPQTFLNGKGASAQHTTIVLGTPGSHIQTDGDVYLNAEGTSAELLHRGVCTGGKMYQGGVIVANAAGRGHVDCAGMMLETQGEGFIQSIPGLRTYHPDARLSHEASIGKIAPEQLEYLMSRGLEEMEAMSLLIRGFLGADIAGLGDQLDEQIAQIAEIAGHGEE